MLEPLAILKSVRADSGEIIDFEWTFINEAGAEALLLPVEAALGHRLCEVLPEHRTGLFDIYKSVVETGEPYVGHEIGYDDRWGTDEVLPRVFNIRAARVGDGFAVSWNDVTDHVEARHRLVRANSELRLHEQIVERASEGIWVIDENNRTTYVNEAMARMVGSTPADMAGTDIFNFIDPDSQEAAAQRLRRIGHEAESRFEFRLLNRAGEEVWTRMTTTPLESPTGDYLGGFALVTDITDEVLSARQRRVAESMFTQATEHAPIGQAIVGLDGTFLEVNPALCRITGFTKDELTGVTFQEITHPDDVDADVDQAVALAAGDIDSYVMDKRYIRADGSATWVQLHASVTRDDEGRPLHYIAQVVDIDKQRKAEDSAANAIERLAFRSTHDALTSLPNRSKFLSHLNRAMHSTNDDSIAVLFIDIDQFKRVNDGISHSSGDAVLVDVGRRISSCVREGDVVGRLGGDEFAVVAREIEQTDDAMHLADRVRQVIAQHPFDTDGNRVHITVSIGVARSSAGIAPHEILSRADAALHSAKARGRNCCQLADREMIDQARKRLSLIDRLHEGVAREQFRPWFQKIVDLETGAVVGHEVLARWVNDDGVIEAGHFIDAAEDSGLITTIGGSVIAEAIRNFADVEPSHFLAINASPAQLRVPGFARAILSQLALGGIDSHRVALEITEQSLFGNESTIIGNLSEFHENHVDLYVDDFGTGYSSISTLRDYPIGGIKLDRSFSERLSSDPTGSIAQLVSGLSELATHLRLDRIAEGIEDQACADRLRELGWLRGQGYLYGQAAPLKEQDPATPTTVGRGVPLPRPRTTGRARRNAADKSPMESRGA